MNASKANEIPWNAVGIPTKPAMHSNLKPATRSDLKPARVPTGCRPRGCAFPRVILMMFAFGGLVKGMVLVGVIVGAVS